MPFRNIYECINIYARICMQRERKKRTRARPKEKEKEREKETKEDKNQANYLKNMYVYECVHALVYVRAYLCTSTHLHTHTHRDYVLLYTVVLWLVPCDLRYLR